MRASSRRLRGRRHRRPVHLDAAAAGPDRAPVRVLRHPAHPLGLPLAAARNAGAERRALGRCRRAGLPRRRLRPGPRAIGAYAAAAASLEPRGDSCAGPSPICRPRPAAATTRHDRDARRPASGAPRARTWRGDPRGRPRSVLVALVRGDSLTWRRSAVSTRIRGLRRGGHRFRGHRRAPGVDLAWVGAARAYHQHHPVESPPGRTSTTSCATRPCSTPGGARWPMEGWLAAFEEAGLIARSPTHDVYEKL